MNHQALADRFVRYVIFDHEGHWHWTASKTFSVGKSSTTPARYAWSILCGPLEKSDVLHPDCEVEGCVNPEHWIKGDRATGWERKRAQREPRRCAQGHLIAGANVYEWKIKGKHMAHVCRACKQEEAKMWSKGSYRPVGERQKCSIS